MSGAPYGYRYVKQSEHMEGFWEIDEAQAQVVREVFARYVNDGVSIGELARWLTERGRPDQDRQDALGPLDDLGDAAQPRLPRAGRVREDQDRRAARRPDAHHPPARRAARPPADPHRPAGREVDADPGPAARHRGDVRARAGPPGRQRALRQAQHQGADAAAGRARLPRVRLLLLPHLHPNLEQADQLLPLHRPGRLAAPRRQRCTSGPVRADELDPLVWAEVRRLLEDPAARSRRDRPPSRRAAHRAPRRPPPRHARTRPHPRRPSNRPPDRGLPRTTDLARRTPRPDARAAQAPDHAASPARQPRRRAARRRDLPPTRRHPRRVPRPPHRRPGPARHRRPAAHPAARRARSADRRRRRHRHDPPLDPDPHRPQ